MYAKIRTVQFSRHFPKRHDFFTIFVPSEKWPFTDQEAFRGVREVGEALIWPAHVVEAGDRVVLEVGEANQYLTVQE
jgi:hypothetical protein